MKNIIIIIGLIFRANLLNKVVVACGLALCISENSYCQDIKSCNYSDSVVYTFVEVMPEYKGGIENFYRDLVSMIDFNMFECGNNKGYILVEFIINKNGELVDERIIKDDPLSEHDKLLLDILKKLQKWTYGIHNGEPVNVRLTIPIHL